MIKYTCLFLYLLFCVDILAEEPPYVYKNNNINFETKVRGLYNNMSHIIELYDYNPEWFRENGWSTDTARMEIFGDSLKPRAYYSMQEVKTKMFSDIPKQKYIVAIKYHEKYNLYFTNPKYHVQFYIRLKIGEKKFLAYQFYSPVENYGKTYEAFLAQKNDSMYVKLVEYFDGEADTIRSIKIFSCDAFGNELMNVWTTGAITANEYRVYNGSLYFAKAAITAANNSSFNPALWELVGALSPPSWSLDYNRQISDRDSGTHITEYILGKFTTYRAYSFDTDQYPNINKYCITRKN